MTESRSGLSSSASARATASMTVAGRNAPASSWASVVRRASNSGAGRGVAGLEGGLGMILANVRGRLRVQDFLLVARSEEHTSELQSRLHLVCRLLLEKKKKEHEMTQVERCTVSQHTDAVSA